MTILSLKWAESYPKSLKKTQREKEKLLITSNFSFSHSVFKRLVLQTRENLGLFGKGLIYIFCWMQENANIALHQKKGFFDGPPKKITVCKTIKCVLKCLEVNDFLLWKGRKHSEIKNTCCLLAFYSFSTLFLSGPLVVSETKLLQSQFGVCMCFHLSEFVQTVTSTIVDGFQNNLTELFSITCRRAFWNIRSGRPKVKVTHEGQNFVCTIAPAILDGF